MQSQANVRAALAELVAAVTAPDAFPLEVCPFVDGEQAAEALATVRLATNPRIVAALAAARAALGGCTW